MASPETSMTARDAAGPRFVVGSHVPGLDSLRGITILWTLFYHYNHVYGGTNLFEKAYIGGALLGVAAIDVFFVISGFLITGILLDSKGSPTFYRTFYSRRALRIFPLYYGFLLVWFVVMPHIMSGDISAWTPPWRIEAWYWLYGQNFLPSVVGPEMMPPKTYHLWSLALEEQFYLTWPLAVGMLRRDHLKKLCIGLFFFAPVFRTALWLADVRYEVGFLALPGRGDTLAIGCLLAIVAREPGGFARALRLAKPAFIVSMAVILGTMVIKASFYPQIPFVRTWGMTVSAIAAAAVTVLTIALNPAGLISRVINARPLLYVGAISYGVYVFHWPVEFLANRFGFTFDLIRDTVSQRMAAQAIYSFTLVGTTLLVSAMAWHFFEKPILALRRYLPYSAAAKAPRAVTGTVGVGSTAGS